MKRCSINPLQYLILIISLPVSRSRKKSFKMFYKTSWKNMEYCTKNKKFSLFNLQAHVIHCCYFAKTLRKTLQFNIHYFPLFFQRSDKICLHYSVFKKYDLGIESTENIYSTKSIGDNIIIFQINLTSSLNSNNETISRFLVYDIGQNKVIREIRN